MDSSSPEWVEVVNGEIVPLSDEQIAVIVAEREANRLALEAQAAAEAALALAAMTLDEQLVAGLATDATYLARATQTTAQNTAQIRHLTTMVDALVRRVLGGDLLAP